MRAILIREHGEPESLKIEDIPTPAIGDDEVLIDVSAIGVNYPDLLVIGGQYQILPPRPFSPGKDAAGVVAAAGRSVTSCKPGDRVVAQVEYGAYAEQLVARGENCFVIPDAMSFTDAAAMGLVYQTAHFALMERGQFRPGETVLVNGGGGGVGLAAIQIARAFGATVLAGVREQVHAQLARESGADHIIDLGAENLHEEIRRQVHAVTNGRGADVVLDPLGGDAFDASMRAMAWRGRMVVIGFAAGRIPTIKANYLLVKNIAVSGLQWSDYRERDPAWVRRVQDELFALYEAGKLRPNVMRAFPMDRFAEALSLVKNGKVNGKVVLTTDSNHS
ncbi:MAG TPA: NADPH:quinone oxidoreductase family protein [Noviherbaspirillum sp.]|uniref:NADPH:quinone oxidoreductase family protein n=1 Tax=Noviherbaspirillum sp. TaxID=1926288 RepID=UPI002D5BFE16|nr:NADPH:quinone oxidoreductase family protein [Noviherbaspirillum sp.]HYD94523.1 NADPH:quinone oxidoreductase family protein [Noviherbaspirillum sp.]